MRVPFAAEAIYGGQLLGVRTQDFIAFYDWATGKVRGVGGWAAAVALTAGSAAEGGRGADL